MSINVKQKFLQMIPVSSTPQAVLDFLNNLDDDDYIINITPSSNEHDLINKIHEKIDDINSTVTVITSLTSLEKEHIGKICSKLKDLIIKIIESFQEKIIILTDNVKTLEAKVDVLVENQMASKRLKMIAEILSPLKKSIFRDMLMEQIPGYYYNVNILKCLYSSTKNDMNSKDFYINIFKIDNIFDEEKLHLFQNLIYSLSGNLNVQYDILLYLLIDKEKRNFSEHSLIFDFLNDSRKTNDNKLTTLLKQEHIYEAFNFPELVILDTIYNKYFVNVLNRH
ncbi:hypothetical protein I4U23_021686 [Adineta vaga]|nr:hypothetical protein I4U23_021686 [Adineta vaga]